MTNFEYIKNSDIDALAEILVSFLLVALNATDIPEDIILEEKAGVIKWLKTEIVEGKFLN